MAEPKTPKKTETKSESTASDSSTSADSTSSASSTESKSSSSSSGGGGKSSRESVGGSGAVHYGYFSNIKSPEYKSGWDDIWGKESSSETSSGAKNSTGKKAVAKKTVRKKEPVFVSLSMDDLPDQLQKELVSAARAKLKKSRLSYDSRNKAGAVSWRIECEVRR